LIYGYCRNADGVQRLLGLIGDCLVDICDVAAHGHDPINARSLATTASSSVIPGCLARNCCAAQPINAGVVDRQSWRPFRISEGFGLQVVNGHGPHDSLRR
jgi:hypothetical protein